MAILEIRKYPDEILKKKALPVENIDKDLQRLIDNMVETMYAAPGIGLAAPQVGVSKRLIVIDVSTKNEKHPLIVLINPEIIEADGFIDSEEGCLSVPGYTSTIKRAGRVVVKGLDRNGKPFQIEGTGLLARALQHEIDHLDGILFVDRMSSIKREFFKKRYLKRQEVERIRG
ncbi:peptide deformylase [Dissulfurispira thermophila]|uniref:Peptide deformylase n=2 Tax=root TaxID=1 RepID=A0A7G1H499_9BACT|nr:peptide deformylase [Dissulfurispira thermophila]BCB96972.1 peptide deformylase [Dissulfurispira thermophila]